MLTQKVSPNASNAVKTRTCSTMGKTAVNFPSRTTDMQQMASQSNTVVQAQLETTQPGDSYEQEADAMANLVMRKMSSGESTSPSISSRTSAPVISCFGGGGLRLSSGMESQLNSMSGGGHAMPAGLRSQMEGSFGRSFSGVRLHTDASASNLSSQLQAKAFTHGNDIYFGQGQYNPSSQQGQSLIAHELTHTVQQSGKVARYNGTGYYEEEYKKKGNKSTVRERYKEGDKKIYISQIDITMNKFGFEVKKHKDKETKKTIYDGIVLYIKGDLVYTVVDENGNKVRTENVNISGGGDQMMLYGEEKSDKDLLPGQKDPLYYFTNRLENHTEKVGQIKGWGYNSGGLTGGNVPVLIYDRKTKKVISRGLIKDLKKERDQDYYAEFRQEKEDFEKIYKDYSDTAIGNMDYAVFFNDKRGEAIHYGYINRASHGCIHVENMEKLKEINHLSVPGKTKVNLKYDDTLKVANVINELQSLGILMKIIAQDGYKNDFLHFFETLNEKYKYSRVNEIINLYYDRRKAPYSI